MSRDLPTILTDLKVDQTTTLRQYLIAYLLLTVAWWMTLFVSPDCLDFFFTFQDERNVILFFVTLGCDVILSILLFVMIIKKKTSKRSMIIATFLVYAGWLCSAYFGFCYSRNVWGLYIMSIATVAFTAMLKEVMGWNILWGPFHFRPSQEDDPRKRIASVISQTAVMNGIFLFAIPLVISLFEIRFLWRVWLPKAHPVWSQLLLVGILLGVLIGIQFVLKSDGTPLPIDGSRKLIISGPYAFVRNPMAIIGITNGILVGLAWNSMLVVTYALCGAVLWEICVRPLEETYLSETFGEEYERYRKQVRCWIPRFIPYRPS